MAQVSTKELMARARSVLAAQQDVLFAYLFGSGAKGRLRAGSDLDIAVFLRGGGRNAYGAGPRDGGGDRVQRARRALALEAELERAVGRRVQVIPLNDAPLGLAHNVLRTGRLLLSSDDRARRRFFVGHARRYFEMEPARRIFDRYRSRRIGQGTFGGRERDGS